MKIPRPALFAFVGLACVLPAIAGELLEPPLGAKGKLVFADDFSADRFGTVWKAPIASTGVENGVMLPISLAAGAL